MVLRGALRFLGGLLVVFLVLGIILGVVGFFAVRNFDPNMFRVEFEKYLTQQTGFRVELGAIELLWRPGPQLRVASFRFFHPQSLEKMLQSGEAWIDVDLAAIWQKHFNVSQIVLQRPEVFLIRDAKGVWNWQFAKSPLAAASDPVKTPSQAGFIPVAEASEENETIPLKSSGPVAQDWDFGVEKVLVRDATVHFTDETAEPAFQLEIEKLEVEVRQIKSALPFHFKAGGSLFHSVKRNLEVEGNLDLAAKSLDFVLRYGPEKAMLKGTLKGIDTQPHFEGTLEIHDLDIESLAPGTDPNSVYTKGRLSSKAGLVFAGANPDTIVRSLDGQGTIHVRDGAVKNRNLVGEVFEHLAPVLAVMNVLGGELPPEVNEMLRGRDTPFQSLQVAYVVKGENVRVNEFRLLHPNFQLSGKGNYGILDKRVEASMELLLSPSISAYLMKKIREMEFLVDREGQITVPFRLSGIFPNAAVQPDLEYIGSKLLQRGVDQLLNRGLGKLTKILGPSSDGASAPGGTETTQPVSKQDRWIQQGMAVFSKIRESQKQ